MPEIIIKNIKWTLSEYESQKYFCVNFVNSDDNKKIVVHISFDYEYIANSDSFRDKSIFKVAIEELEKIHFSDNNESQKIYITFVYE